jgi:hypothetical protein
MRSTVVSCMALESNENAWLATARKYAVDCSKSPMIESTKTSIDSGMRSVSIGSDFRDFLLFLLPEANIRVVALTQA